MTQLAPGASTIACDRPELDTHVCVVGAGPHGLAVVTHLLAAQPSLRDRIVVLDPSGAWLERWYAQFARLEIDVLRSPIVHHPGVGPGALARYVHDERLPRSGLPYDPPLTSSFESYCDTLIDQVDVRALPSAARVRSLTCGDRVTVECATVTVRARHVVWTGNTAAPVVPDAFAGLPAPAERVVHGDRIDLRAVGRLDREHVIVVGGGLTAGHLATAAASRGATVTLVTRRPVVERDFDVEPGWLGPRFLAGFWRLEDPQQRLETARSARGGGSMPGWMHQRISKWIAAGRLDHVVGEIECADATERGVEICVAGRRVPADRCWLATGTRPDALVDDALGCAVEEHIDGMPIVDDDLRIGDSGLFVTGRLATIELGPAAGNLWGARTAARRISRAITGIDLDADDAVAIPPPPVAVSAGTGRS